MVTNHLRIISEHIGEYFQCCDYLLKEKETFVKSMCVCVCVRVYVCLGRVSVCVFRRIQ